MGLFFLPVIHNLATFAVKVDIDMPNQCKVSKLDTKALKLCINNATALFGPDISYDRISAVWYTSTIMLFYSLVFLQ